jgi:hypothetical protein
MREILMNNEIINLLDAFEKSNIVAKKCRETARQIWGMQPKLSMEEMLARFEIREVQACEGEKYPENKLNGWICPDPAASEELPRFKILDSWRLEEAVAIWLDINPFIIMQVKDHGSHFMIAAIMPKLRDKYSKLFKEAESAIRSQKLLSQREDNLHYVQPRRFHEWAIKNACPPSGAAEEFFEVLMQEWDVMDIIGKSNAQDNAEGKVTDVKVSDDVINEGVPGKLPRIGIGKLAIQIAWELECKTRVQATAKEVMAELQRCADNNEHSHTLRNSNRRNKSVFWMTEKLKEKEFSDAACEKALVTWNKSRH